ncbi:hypothetical protein Tco_1070795 [Tanacetum coccineum]|uniref:Uncharacterized protein n=1 Tax=Tanacetum coccineum TaxID=301880 RepID=A0ABQ5HPK3_9ASTR
MSKLPSSHGDQVCLLTMDKEAFDVDCTLVRSMIGNHPFIWKPFSDSDYGGFSNLDRNPQKVVVNFLVKTYLMANVETTVLLGVGKGDAGSTWTWKRTCQLSLANWMQIGYRIVIVDVISLDDERFIGYAFLED